jgi:MoxR-like ATPase
MEDDDGGVLLLDEIDLGSSKIMCLQPVFEGNGVFIKKINRWVYPKPGFTIISTANTKGRGSEDNKYIGTNVMNDALLERLSGATFEHGYPDKNIETKIIKNNLKRFGITDSTFPEPLCTWAEIIRKTYSEGGSDELITTSRLIHIVKSYSIYNRNRLKAIRLALARFDLNTQMSFLDAYTKVDADAKDDSDTNIKPDLPHHSTPSGMTRRPW